MDTGCECNDCTLLPLLSLVKQCETRTVWVTIQCTVWVTARNDHLMTMRRAATTKFLDVYCSSTVLKYKSCFREETSLAKIWISVKYEKITNQILDANDTNGMSVRIIEWRRFGWQWSLASVFGISNIVRHRLMLMLKPLEKDCCCCVVLCAGLWSRQTPE